MGDEELRQRVLSVMSSPNKWCFFISATGISRERLREFALKGGDLTSEERNVLLRKFGAD